VNRLHSNAKFL